MKLVPVHEFAWGSDLSTLKEMTCRNHTDARYLTKNPWLRSIHIDAFPKGDIERSESGECTCPFSDLMVMVKDEPCMIHLSLIQPHLRKGARNDCADCR